MVNHTQLNDYDDNRDRNSDENDHSFEGISHQDEENSKGRDNSFNYVEEYLSLGEDLVISVEQDDQKEQAKRGKIDQHVQE